VSDPTTYDPAEPTEPEPEQPPAEAAECPEPEQPSAGVDDKPKRRQSPSVEDKLRTLRTQRVGQLERVLSRSARLSLELTSLTLERDKAIVEIQRIDFALADFDKPAPKLELPLHAPAWE